MGTGYMIIHNHNPKMYENMKFQHLAKHNTDDFHKGGIRSHKKNNTGLDVMKVMSTAAGT